MSLNRLIVIGLLLLPWVCPAAFSMDLGRAWVEPESGTVNEVGDLDGSL